MGFDRLASIVTSFLLPSPRVIQMGSLVRVLVEEPTGSSRRVIRAALGSGWRESIGDLRPRVSARSTSVERWTVDFGDGAVAEEASQATEITVSHEYSPGFYLVTVTARVEGTQTVPISLPHVVVSGMGEDPVMIEFNGLATLLINH